MKYYFDERYEKAEKKWADWNKFFKFTTVRNPWDRKLSTFSYLKEKAKQFKKFDSGIEHGLYKKYCKLIKSVQTLKSILKILQTSQKKKSKIDWVLDNNGNNMLDFIGKVENLEHDLKYAFKQIGLPEPKLVHTNKSNHRPYTEAYDEQWMIDKVAERYKDDIFHFNYEFGN